MAKYTVKIYNKEGCDISGEQSHIVDIDDPHLEIGDKIVIQRDD